MEEANNNQRVNELSELSGEARYCLSEITWAIDYWHQVPLDRTLDDPVLMRLRGLAEFLISWIDSAEVDVEDMAYQLRFDPNTGDPRDLKGLLRSTDEEIERAGEEALDSEVGHVVA
jgi:hypothetical protein